MGGKALLYFEIVTTFALAIGLVVVNVIEAGRRDSTSPRSPGGDVSRYATQGKAMTLRRLRDAHRAVEHGRARSRKGDMLQVVFFAVLFGVALRALGETRHGR